MEIITLIIAVIALAISVWSALGVLSLTKAVELIIATDKIRHS